MTHCKFPPPATTCLGRRFVWPCRQCLRYRDKNMFANTGTHLRLILVEKHIFSLILHLAGCSITYTAQPEPILGAQHLPVVDSTVLAKNNAEVKSQFQLAEALLRMETP